MMQPNKAEIKFANVEFTFKATRFKQIRTYIQWKAVSSSIVIDWKWNKKKRLNDSSPGSIVFI